MDVAADGDHAGLVEYDRLCRRADVQRQLEALRRRERIHVMAHAVAIGERDRAAGVDRLHVRHELQVDLLDLVDPGARPPAQGTLRDRDDHRVGHRPALLVAHGGAQIRGFH